MTILSVLVLREKIGLIRNGAVLLGFIGVFIATGGPGSRFTLLQIAVGLGYAFLASCVDIALRWLGNAESASTTTLYFLLFGLLVTGVYMPFSEITVVPPMTIFILGALGLGVFNLGHLLAKSQSFRSTEASRYYPYHLYDAYLGGFV